MPKEYLSTRPLLGSKTVHRRSSRARGRFGGSAKGAPKSVRESTLRCVAEVVSESGDVGITMHQLPRPARARHRPARGRRRSAARPAFDSACREPSWRENIEFRAKIAIKRENIDQEFSHIRWLCSWLEDQAAPVSKSIRKLVAVLRIYKKVGIVNSQINWLRRAILSN